MNEREIIERLVDIVDKMGIQGAVPHAEDSQFLDEHVSKLVDVPAWMRNIHVKTDSQMNL